MKKNEAWVAVGSSTAAGLLCYLVISILVNEMSLFWKAVTISIVVIIALAISFWGGKNTDKNDMKPPKIKIASGIKTNGGVTIDKVNADAKSGGDIKIGNNITAQKDVKITNIGVGQKGK